jgi:hypothetical protein
MAVSGIAVYLESVHRKYKIFILDAFYCDKLTRGAGIYLSITWFQLVSEGCSSYLQEGG